MANRRRRSGRKIDYKQWSGTATGLHNVDQATSTASGVIATVTVPATLLRVRGVCAILPDEASPSDGDALLVAAGITVVKEGQTTFASPLSDPEGDWLWHGYATVLFEQGGFAVSYSGPNSDAWSIDSKAMRRMMPAEEVRLVLDGQQLSGTPTYSYLAAVRVLIGT